MPANTDLRWLKPTQLKGAARRFAEFCKTDIKQQASSVKDFNPETYSQAAKLIISKLQTPRDDNNKGDE